MSKELVISANRHETKVAILEDDQLVEVFFQRANEYSLAGSIHKGRVTRVLPGMQSAFVDLGLERDTFLYVSDFFEEVEEDFDRLPEPRREESRRDDPRRDEPRRDEPRRERENRPPASLREVSRAEEEPAARTEPEIASDSQPAEVAPAAIQPPKREDDGRDRRGRSRRRRNRGRGFPESKYASSESRFEGPRGPRPVEAPPPPTESRDERPAPSGAADSFSVLPGESLAKYTRSNIAPLDDAEEEEIRNLQSPPNEAEAEAEADIEAQMTSEAHVAEEPQLVETAVEVEAPEQENLSSRRRLKFPSTNRASRSPHFRNWRPKRNLPPWARWKLRPPRNRQPTPPRLSPTPRLNPTMSSSTKPSRRKLPRRRNNQLPGRN